MSAFEFERGAGESRAVWRVTAMAHWACTIKRALAVVIVIAVLAALAACGQQAQPPEVIRPVRTLVAGYGATDAANVYPGEVKPRIESRLGFRVGGKLIDRRVDVGQTVKAGEVLARLDAQDLALAQTAARAQLDAARTDLALAEADFARYRDLYAQNFIGKAELDRRQATLDGARAKHEQAQANYRSQANQAGYAVLVADAPGVVTAVEAEVGQVVAAGTVVVRIARSAAKEVAFSVPEDRIDALRGARRAQVTLWALPVRTYDARVREIAAAADIPLNADFENGFAVDPDGVAANVRRAVRENWEQAGVAGGDLVLVACSGGADSLALAAASATT